MQTITLFCVQTNDHYPDCDLQVPAFREIAKNYLNRVRGGGEENQNEHSEYNEETETRVDEN